MYPLGHYGMALLFAAPSALVLSKRQSVLFTAFVLAAAMLPDMDLLLPLTHHHGGMHTIAFAIVGSITVGLAFTAAVGTCRMALRGRLETPLLSEWTLIRLSSSAFAVGIASHIVADVLVIPIGDNPVEPFWPVSHHVVSFWLVYPGEPLWNKGLFLMGLLAQAAVVFDVRGTLSDRLSPESRS